ncbi:hypothetical protein LMG27177_01453 [Paraburkholderia fynbosensis]|uniref:Uncharacterized protein n=1 Tax=Paraburkholderia fynbosensis TaxID=1200993 RepID=A0A6J5FRJ9_9BURK|nr:hypothetical protein LMG27177_01453 [Paraburkholderia fynbosensis]
MKQLDDSVPAHGRARKSALTTPSIAPRDGSAGLLGGRFGAERGNP